MNEPSIYQTEAVGRRAAKFQHDPKTLEFLSDVVTIAIEGGIGYWSECRDYKWRNVPAASAEIRDIDGVRPAEWTMLDVYAVEAGILTIINEPAKVGVSPDRIKAIAGAWATLDGGDIDAELADCIVQAGIFGEVIYG